MTCHLLLKSQWNSCEIFVDVEFFMLKCDLIKLNWNSSVT